MLAQLLSGAVLGVDAYLVRVEVDQANGLPSMAVVGLPEGAVREGRERVWAAVQNSGYSIPPKRITINLAPADIRKEGSAYDLPIAIGILAGSGVVPVERVAGRCLAGELGLDGEVRPIRGALSLALRCREEGVEELIVPVANAREAAVVEGVRVRAAAALRDVVQHLQGAVPLPDVRVDPSEVFRDDAADGALDLADVRGHEHAKRAVEVAAAGGHNLLLIGPPGSGKSMLARRLPTILPPLTLAESIEVTKVHSVAGRMRAGAALVRGRPFRAPHHSISEAGLIGGGSVPRPGEASLAHHGILFLDELPEFRRTALEALRQPLEDGVIQLGRARLMVSYPARFTLVAAMNPCPCGYFGDGTDRCRCPASQVERYLSRVSGPLLDRIDLHIEVPALTDRELKDRRAGEPSAVVRERVCAARLCQLERFAGRAGIFANAHMGAREVREFCRLDAAGEALIGAAVAKLRLSARSYHRVLRMARTIADLEGSDRIAAAHVAEAVQYRSLDRYRPGAAVGAEP